MLRNNNVKLLNIIIVGRADDTFSGYVRRVEILGDLVTE